ncbi:hypothetical protein DOT_2701 [Desulfosporosinus sp. OT]|nr:hypothetical protein DOT_2701 [Desulfosporosinus sp. OT]
MFIDYFQPRSVQFSGMMGNGVTLALRLKKVLEHSKID